MRWSRRTDDEREARKSREEEEEEEDDPLETLRRCWKRRPESLLRRVGRGCFGKVREAIGTGFGRGKKNEFHGM